MVSSTPTVSQSGQGSMTDRSTPATIAAAGGTIACDTPVRKAKGVTVTVAPAGAAPTRRIAVSCVSEGAGRRLRDHETAQKLQRFGGEVRQVLRSGDGQDRSVTKMRISSRPHFRGQALAA